MIKLVSAEPTPYERLGVRRDASDACITKIWRKLALKHHPDRRHHPGGGFELMVSARDQLSDAKRRAEYDTELAAAITAGRPPKLVVDSNAAAQALCHADDNLPVVAVCSVSFLSPGCCLDASDSATTGGLGIWIGSASTQSELDLRVVDCLNQRAKLIPMRLVLSGARGKHGCARLRALDFRLLAVASMLAPTLVMEAPCKNDAFKSLGTDDVVFSDELACLEHGLRTLQSQQVSVPWPVPTLTVMRAVDAAHATTDTTSSSDAPSAGINPKGSETSGAATVRLDPDRGHNTDSGGYEVTLDLTKDEMASLSAPDDTLGAGAALSCSARLRPLERVLLLIGANGGAMGGVGGVCTRLLDALPLRLNILCTNSCAGANTVVNVSTNARGGLGNSLISRPCDDGTERGRIDGKTACIRSLPPLEASSGMWEPSNGRLHVSTTLFASLTGAAANAASESITSSDWVGSAVALRDAVDGALAASCRDHVSLCASVYSDVMERAVEGVHSVETDHMRAAHERALVAALCRLVIFETGLSSRTEHNEGAGGASRAAEAIAQLVRHAEQEYALFCAANALARGQDQGPTHSRMHSQPRTKVTPEGGARELEKAQEDVQVQEQAQEQGREQIQEQAHPETEEQIQERLLADKRVKAAESARIEAEEQAKSHAAAARVAQSQTEDMRTRAERAEHELLILRTETEQLREQLAAQRSRDIEQIKTGLEADAQSMARKQETLDSIHQTLCQIDVQQREGAVEARKQHVATSERIDEVATSSAATAAAAAAAGTSNDCTGVTQTRAPWVDNRDATRCWQCSRDFGLLVRRHHCRSCGAVFCGKCSSHRSPIPSQGYEEAVRVCDKCYHESQQQHRNGDDGGTKNDSEGNGTQ